MTDHEQLQQQGFILLRQAIPGEWLNTLRAAFDNGVMPSAQWPVPRHPQWRHSLLDEDPTIQAVCRLPSLLAAVGELIGERFFLAQVEGREPLPQGGHQPLHRDLSQTRPGDTAGALAFFDEYGPDNGATRLIPASHRPSAEEQTQNNPDESLAIQLSGHAGDILVFDVDLLHGASLNVIGTRRRSILINYAAESLHASYLKTAPLRNVRMDTSERFSPDHYRFR